MTRDEAAIGEDVAYQAIYWRVQRVAWTFLVLLLGASVLGMTGASGFLSYRTVSDDTFSIRYPAILRQQSEDTFLVTLQAPDSQVILKFDAAFADRFTITSTSPPFDTAFATSDGVAYRFEAVGPGPITLEIDVFTERPARGDYTIVADGRMALLSSTILP